ncbi:MAG TPA: phage holin family protein [Acidimicrobiia bacterium]|nr:phage holin family protein [Acidimicrobiia bacterium]
MRKLLQLAATAAGVWVAVQLVPGLEFDGSAWAFVGVALLVAVANAIVKPILSFFSFPLILVTLGLFLLVINALVLQLVVWLSAPERLDLGLTSTGFFWATFLGALVISLVRWVLEAVLED